MRTRRGSFYQTGEGVRSEMGAATLRRRRWRRRREEEEEETGFSRCKRRRRGIDLFDALPDDIVLSILSKLSASARRPSDFISVLLTYVAESPYPFSLLPISRNFFLIRLSIVQFIFTCSADLVAIQLQEIEGVRPQLSGAVEGVG